MKFKRTIFAVSISSMTMIGITPVQAAFNDAGTEYSEARQSAHMWTPGMEALDTVNNILCFVDQLRAGEMVNRGVYTALVDEKKCDVGSSGDSRDRGPQQQFVIVESVRADDGAPQKAKFWIPGMNGPGEQPMLVKAYMSISDEPTETNPLQDFTLRFDMYANEDGSGAKIGGGFIKATPSSQLAEGKIGIKFYEQMSEGGESFVSAANIIKNPDGSDGVAITRSVDHHGSTAADRYYGLSWNEATIANRVKIKDGDSASNNSDLTGTEVCLAKDQLKSAVWDYGVYAEDDFILGSTSYTAGDEITLESGFPILYGSNGDQRGFMGYWGLWTDDGSTPTDNVRRVDYSTNPPALSDIDLSSAPGKLWMNTIKNLSLAQIDGIEFQYGEDDGFGSWTDYVIEYDHANTKFIKTATVSHSNTGPEKTAIAAADVDLSGQDKLWLWSQQLGGQITIGVDAGVPTSVVVAERSLVNPGSDLFGNADSDVTLKCYSRCPRAAISASQTSSGDGAESPYLTDQLSTDNAYDYTINRTDMTLRLGGADVAFDTEVSEEDLAGSNYQWGVNSGILVPAGTTVESLDKLYDGSISQWYEWETGVQSWNQYTIVTENGSPIVFDEPLKFTLSYDHSSMKRSGADQGADFDGQTFLLEYGGDGQLWGFPMIDAGDDHFYPAIALADGTLISNGSNDFVVKAWNIEQKMNAVNSSECSALILGDVPGGIPAEIDTSIPGNADDIPDEAEELAPSVVNGVVKVTLE